MPENPIEKPTSDDAPKKVYKRNFVYTEARKQDAVWWYEKFGGFEYEVYALLEYGDNEVPKEITEYLKQSFQSRQDKLLEKFSNGGRTDPFEEELQMDDFLYITKDKVNELHPTRDIFE